MPKGIYKVPVPVNEPVKMYAPGSPERAELKKMLEHLRSEELDIPMYIGGKEVRSGKTVRLAPPHDHKHTLGHFHKSGKEHITQAIDAALAARERWVELSWEHRASIFLKAADLIAGPYRAKLNAATMLGQSKNAFQAEIDSACEIIDFLRFNVQYMTEIYAQQPASNPGMWNRLEWRPLEGFIYALTPFNFTAIAGNLPTSCAMMGNVVVWKPSNTQVYSANVLMEIFREAGVPDGVINLIYPSGPEAAEVIFNHRDFAGIHFTGSTEVFQNIWQTIGNNIHLYRSYPRIVGETGGKDFIVAHSSADPKAVITAISRGAFEYQGQKCSAASRAYIPSNMWEEVKKGVQDDIASFKMGPVEDFSNFINAVIDEKSFDKLAKYIDAAKKDPDVEIVAGGTYDKSKGYYIAPTVLRACTTRTSSERRWSWWIPPPSTRSPAPSSPATVMRSSWPRRSWCMPPATSTSTTSRRARWSGSSRSAARAAPARTTRPARWSTCCVGFLRVRLKKRGCRRQTTVIPSFQPNK